MMLTAYREKARTARNTWVSSWQQLCVAVTLVFFGAWPVAYAAADTIKGISSPVGAPEVMKMAVGLLVVCGVMFVSLYLMKRFQQVKLTKGSHIKVVSGMNISVRDKVLLLEVNDQQILVGVSPGRVQTLHVFTKGVADSQQKFGEQYKQALQAGEQS